MSPSLQLAAWFAEAGETVAFVGPVLAACGAVLALGAGVLWLVRKLWA